MHLKKGIHFYLVLGLFAVYLANGLIAIPQNSVTYDEMDHWSYGKRILKGQPEKIYPFDDASAMPVSGVNAIPRAVEQVLNPGLLKTDGGFSDIMHGRYVTLLLCLLTGLFIYCWSKELFGKLAGIFSLALFVFCPNLNAHGTLLTTDAYTALFTVSTFYFFWKFVKKSGWKYFLLFSASLGVAQLVKYSMLYLFILLAVVSLLLLVKRKTLFSHFKKNFLRLVALSVIVLFIINAGFLFKSAGKSFSAYSFASKACRSVQKNSLLNKIPLPLPEAYIKGIDLTQYMNELGAGHPEVSNKNYLLGVLRAEKGFPLYYFVVFLFKTPLSALLSLLMFSVLLVTKRKRFDNFYTVSLLLAGALYFITCFGLFSNTQVGLRHVILIYPLLYVAVGAVVSYMQKKRWGQMFLVLTLGYSIFSFYKFFPNLISYHNELVSSTNTYRIMADSNIDYGQSVFRYENYRKDHPEVKVPGAKPEAGNFILGVDIYVGVNEKYKTGWLSGNFKPSGHFDHCYLLFSITEKDLAERGLK